MSTAIVPIARVTMSVRPATLADMPFIDSLQKRHGKQLGFFPRAQMQGYVEAGSVLIAEGTEARRTRAGKKAAARTPKVEEAGGPQEPTPKPRAAMQFGVPSAKPAVIETTPEPTVEQPPTELAKLGGPRAAGPMVGAGQRGGVRLRRRVKVPRRAAVPL